MINKPNICVKSPTWRSNPVKGILHMMTLTRVQKIIY